MRTAVDIIKAVSGLIETEFGAPPATKDIREGFDRPCFFVEPNQIRHEKAGDMSDDTTGIRIYYFSARTQTGYLDLLQKQAELQDLLDAPIQVSEDFYLFPEDAVFDIQREDMTLVAEFTVENIQLMQDTDESELMGEIEINLREDE